MRPGRFASGMPVPIVPTGMALERRKSDSDMRTLSLPEGLSRRASAPAMRRADPADRPPVDAPAVIASMARMPDTKLRRFARTIELFREYAAKKGFKASFALASELSFEALASLPGRSLEAQSVADSSGVRLWPVQFPPFERVQCVRSYASSDYRRFSGETHLTPEQSQAIQEMAFRELRAAFPKEVANAFWTEPLSTEPGAESDDPAWMSELQDQAKLERNIEPYFRRMRRRPVGDVHSALNTVETMSRRAPGERDMRSSRNPFLGRIDKVYLRSSHPHSMHVRGLSVVAGLLNANDLNHLGAARRILDIAKELPNLDERNAIVAILVSKLNRFARAVEAAKSIDPQFAAFAFNDMCLIAEARWAGQPRSVERPVSRRIAAALKRLSAMSGPGDADDRVARLTRPPGDPRPPIGFKQPVPSRVASDPAVVPGLAPLHMRLPTRPKSAPGRHRAATTAQDVLQEMLASKDVLKSNLAEDVQAFPAFAAAHALDLAMMEATMLSGQSLNALGSSGVDRRPGSDGTAPQRRGKVRDFQPRTLYADRRQQLSRDSMHVAGHAGINREQNAAVQDRLLDTIDTTFRASAADVLARGPIEVEPAMESDRPGWMTNLQAVAFLERDVEPFFVNRVVVDPFFVNRVTERFVLPSVDEFQAKLASIDAMPDGPFDGERRLRLPDPFVGRLSGRYFQSVASPSPKALALALAADAVDAGRIEYAGVVKTIIDQATRLPVEAERRAVMAVLAPKMFKLSGAFRNVETWDPVLASASFDVMTALIHEQTAAWKGMTELVKFTLFNLEKLIAGSPPEERPGQEQRLADLRKTYLNPSSSRR